MPVPIFIAAFLTLDVLLGIAVGKFFLKGPRDLPFADSDLDKYEAARKGRADNDTPVTAGRDS